MSYLIDDNITNKDIKFQSSKNENLKKNTKPYQQNENKNDEIQNLKEELKKIKDQFNSKQKELKEYKRTIKDNQKENEELKKKN